jgi:tetratricopeptide (TPR) repeat protein
VLDSLGYAHHGLGRYADATAYCEQAVAAFGELGDRYGLTEALRHLGDTYCAAGDATAARGAWERALVILEDLRHPDAEQVRATLRGLAEKCGDR